MQALQERSARGSRRRWPWLVALVALVVAAGGVAYAVHRGNGGPGDSLSCAKGVSCTGGGSSASEASARTLTVASLTPSTGATNAASDTTVTVRFSSAVESDGQDPSISPAVAGSWKRSGSDELVFTPSAPFVPYTKYTVTVPGGAGGVRADDGGHLASSVTASFTVAAGSTLRLQQLLAQLGYLPLAYAPPDGTPAPQDMAMPQPGTLSWRWSGLPTQLTSQWVQGTSTVITKAAVMTFETQNGLTVDGIAGPQVWSVLLADVTTKKGDTAGYTYVLVTKTLPDEHLTAWVNGSLEFSHILVNTGVPGATTTDGTFEVFEHVRASDMKGTNVTGSTYTDPTVPWASYFDGGEALHGFPRAAYGYPQSNGCVEMQITTAGNLWPYTPIGTLVTVQGPPAT